MQLNKIISKLQKNLMSVNKYSDGSVAIETTAALTAVFAVCMVYIYFFIIGPQHWSWMDDYAEVIKWGSKADARWSDFVDFNQSLMSVGRFRPVDVLFRFIRYSLIPVTPGWFHVWQLVLSFGAVAFLGATIKSQGLGRVAQVAGIFCALTALSFKEGIFYSTSAEVPALFFLMAALWTQAKNLRVVSVLCFISAFFSKEPIALLAPVFALVGSKSFDIKTMLQRSWGHGLVAATFIAFLKLLPQEYSGGMSFTKIDAAFIWAGLINAPLKSLGPGILVIVAGLMCNKQRTHSQRVFLYTGSYIVLVYSVLLMTWGYFDSWFYLHAPIAYGWAMIMAGAIGQTWATRSWQGMLLLSYGAYGFLATLNGSANLNQFATEGEQTATSLCTLAQASPGVKIYSNCQEAADQMNNFLTLTKPCKDVPQIIAQYHPGWQFPVEGDNVAFVYSPKCMPIEINKATWSNSIEGRYWSLYFRAKSK